MNDTWSSGIAYERFMGRWSTLAGRQFLKWLDVPDNSTWLDIGCGSGSLTRLILNEHLAKKIVAIDQSEDFIVYAKGRINHPSVHFQVGQAESLELETNSVDAAVSGLVLNFVSDPKAAVSEMIRVTKPGGKAGIFIWDYAEGMQMLRYFWNAAVELDNNAAQFDEGIRFPLCKKGRLESLLKEAGLRKVEARAIEVETIFKNFDDYWNPFLDNVGPAPNYIMNLTQEDREKLESKLRNSLPANADGSITLKARAWAVKMLII